MYTRYAERSGWKVEIVSENPGEVGGYKEVIVPHRRPRRLFAAEVRIRRPPRAARAGNRIAGPHPHLGLHGGGDAGSRRGRRSRHQPGRPAHRHLPRLRRRRPAHQQDRFRRAHHPPADRAGGGMPGRPLAAPQPGAGHERAGGAPEGPRNPGAARRRGQHPQEPDRHAATAPTASAPTTSRRAASPTTASTSRCTRSTR